MIPPKWPTTTRIVRRLRRREEQTDEIQDETEPVQHAMAVKGHGLVRVDLVAADWLVETRGL